MNEKHTGRFLGIPYDWRSPNWQRFKSTVWNPDDDRIVRRKWWGWGWSFNLNALLRRLGILH